MNQAAAERRLAGHIARQTPAVGIEAGGDFHLGPLFLRDGRPHGKEPLQERAAVAVDVAGHGPDLGVAVAGQRFLHEIEQPGLAL